MTVTTITVMMIKIIIAHMFTIDIFIDYVVHEKLDGVYEQLIKQHDLLISRITSKEKTLDKEKKLSLE